MYKMMVVDDEYLSRYVLKTLVQKKFDNIDIGGEAENGRQAIELNRTLQPDIIIMDIKMPGINGIDASKEIITEYPDTNILILTAYDSFDYIKRALDIGVKGYILKPIKEEEVIEKISKVINSIDERLNQHDLKEKVESKIKVVRPFIEKELVSAFIIGNQDLGKVENYISFLQEEIKSGYFMLISSGQSSSREIDDSIRNKILRDKIYDVALRHLPLMKKCLFGKAIGNAAVVFFPVEADTLPENAVKEALIIAQELKRKLKVIANIDVAVGVGNVYHEIKNFCKSYNEANFALRKAIADKGLVHFGRIENGDNAGNYSEYPIELENRFLEQVKAGSIDKAKELAEEIISHLVDNIGNVEIVKECVSEFVTVLKRTILKMGISINVLKNIGTLFELDGLATIDEIEVWLRRNVYNLIELMEKASNKNADVISRVFDYINKNFHKEITLELVAGEIGMSPQYLSKIFKEKYGTNFIDYITKKRLEYAEELLKNENRNIKEISKMVGYEDSNYFCKVFKKDTGLTPKQYRTKIIARDI